MLNLRPIAVLVIACALIGCEEPSATLIGKNEPQIKRIVAGTERSEAGRIMRKRTTFRPSDRVLYFNAEVINVDAETPVTAYWTQGNAAEPFATYSVKATRELSMAKFELEKASDWPPGEYTIVVGVKAGDTQNALSLLYTIDAE